MHQITKKSRFFGMLCRTALFQDVSPKTARAAFGDDGCRCFSVSAGEVLPLWRSVGLVCAGEVRAYRYTAAGSKILLNTFQRGDLFGMPTAFLQTSVPLARIYAKRTSTILYLEMSLMRKLLAEDEKLSENYIACLSSKVAFLTQRLAVASGGTAQQRLAAWLLSQRLNEDSSLYLPCSIANLSGLLGISRASLYRAMENLQSAGLLQQRGRRIQITDRRVMAVFLGYTDLENVNREEEQLEPPKNRRREAD